MHAKPPPISSADLHVHPSGDAVRRPPRPSTPASIFEALVASGLGVAVLADHDRIDVAQDLVALARSSGAAIELIVGEEITTREGHLLGIGLSSRVAPGMTLDDTVAAIHDQGGLAVVAHPLLPPVFSATPERLLHLAQGDPRRRPDALEVMNAVAAWVPGWRRRVERMAADGGYAMVGGSDAHRAGAVGRARTGFSGSGAAALLEAIRARATWVEGRRSAPRDVLARMRK
jgi:predicted metal-dependent phosphoesterase TrpH